MKKSPALTNPGAATLLREREQQGLRFSIIVNLVMLGFFLSILFTTPQSTFELLVTLASILLSGIVLVVLLFKVSRGEWLGAAGLTITLIHLTLIILLPWVWYFSVGGEAVSRSYLLKAEIFTLAGLFFVLSALPVRPAYPLILSSGSFVYFLGLYFLAISDPRIVFSENFLESVNGEAVSTTLYFNNVFYLLASGLILTVLLQRLRETVTRSVSLEHANSQLERYFSPGIRQMISTSGQDFLKPGGKLQKVAVLFTDIRGFTTISETLSAEQTLEILSLYQEQMVAAIFENGGTLDKFIGDGIMATFGTPIPGERDVSNAVAAGLEMQSRLAQLNHNLKMRNLPVIRHGIGIDYGEVIAGNVGTPARLEYTVIGDVVNTAERIQSECKTTGETFLISQRVAEQINEQFALAEIGQVNLRGKSELVKIFAVRG